MFFSLSPCSSVLMGVSCLGSVVRTDREGSSQFPLTDFMSCASFVGVKKKGHWLVVGSRGWRKVERKYCWKLSDWRYKALYFCLLALRSRFAFYFFRMFDFISHTPGGMCSTFPLQGEDTVTEAQELSDLTHSFHFPAARTYSVYVSVTTNLAQQISFILGKVALRILRKRN